MCSAMLCLPVRRHRQHMLTSGAGQHMLTDAGRVGWLRLVFLQGAWLVDGFAAALLALDQVLRVVLAGAHRAPGRLGVLGDLLFHFADGLAPVRVPADLVALGDIFGHVPALSWGSGRRPYPPTSRLKAALDRIYCSVDQA